MLTLQQQRAAEGYKSMMGDAAKALASLTSDEIAAFIKTFKGTCNKCGAYGHEGANCQKKANRSGDGSAGDDKDGKPRFRGRCNFCGKWGHKREECKLRLAQQQEMANLAKDEEAESFVLYNDDCDESYDELGFVATSRLATKNDVTNQPRPHPK